MKRLIVLLFVLVAPLMVGCGAKKLIVGVVLPETGIAKAYGPSLKAGIKLAMDDAQARNTPPGIEAHYRDSMSNPEPARKETEELIRNGAVLIIGGATSVEAKAMIPEADKGGRPIISPSATEPGLAASSNLFFRLYPADDVEGAVAASFLAGSRQAKTILVVFEKGIYSEGMLPVFEAEAGKLGATIIAKLPIGGSGWDAAIGEALTTRKPDAVFVCAFGEQIGATLGVIRTAGYTGTVCVSSSFYTLDVVKRAGANAEGVFVPVLKLDLTSQQEPVKSFVARYKAANGGKTPDIFAAHAYDAALVALYALEGQRPKDNAELLVRIMSQGGKRGVTGALSFDSVGNTTHRPRIHVIKGGVFEDMDPTPAG